MNGNKIFSILFMLMMMTGLAYAVPGEITKTKSLSSTASVMDYTSTSLQPVVTENGKISWSIDASGSNSTSAYISVAKPAGATVRHAYLMAASVSGYGDDITNSDIALAGSDVTFSSKLKSSIYNSYNYWADVTSIVKPIIDAEAAGTYALEITEDDTYAVDGEVLVVIFDDPNQVNDNTIILAFGAQNTKGDVFNIGLADAIDKSKAGFMLDMSLGISYSYQSGSAQYSQIDVNDVRLTTSAGGEDDGVSINGGLITAGGIGDSNANPANAYATAYSDPRYDDELYNLVPFVEDGDTAISVETLNPSNDDNIFFAGFFLGSTTAVVGEGVVLSPESAVNYLGATHTLTATAQYEDGKKIVDTTIYFEIISGPNAGLNATVLTDADGKAQWSYTSTLTGVDTIRASFLDNTQTPVYSNEVTKEWKKHHSNEEKCVSDLTLIMGTVYDSENAPVAGKEVAVKCTHDDVATVEYVTTLDDGSYTLVMPKAKCQTDDIVVVTADGMSNSGEVKNDCTCKVNLALIDLTIPEFGVIAGAVALVGALGIFVYRRKD